MAHTRAHDRDRGSWVTRFDTLEALAFALFLTPLFVAVYVLVKLDGGPALVAVERERGDGTTVTAWRFRTTAPEPPAGTKAPSFTRLGSLLHSCRLDQLPELATVIRGEMSFSDMMR